MPLYYYRCDSCKADERHLEKQPGERLCRACGAVLIRAPKAPSTRVVEQLDNGVMVKALERLADAPELYRERHDNHIRDVEKPQT